MKLGLIISTTDRGLIWSNVSPWLYPSRAYATLRPLTGTARVIQWTISILGQYYLFKALPHDAILYIHDGLFKITCNALRCIFQRVGNTAPDFEISLLCIVQFPNGLQHYDWHLINIHIICKEPAKYFQLYHSKNKYRRIQEDSIGSR